jgi:hypothetical protein
VRVARRWLKHGQSLSQTEHVGPMSRQRSRHAPGEECGRRG